MEKIYKYEVAVEDLVYMNTYSTIYDTYEAAEKAFQEECGHKEPRFFKKVKLNKIVLHYGNGEVFYIELVERVAEAKV